MYYIKGEMNCESNTSIYLITCIKCLEQYVGYATKFKSRFRIHKFDIKIKKIVVGLLGTLIITAVIPPLPFSIYMTSSLRC